MLRWLKNVGYLTVKELRSLFSDFVLIVLIIHLFSLALYIIASMPTTEMKNGSVGVVDNDKSALTYQLQDALIKPTFKQVESISVEQIDQNMDKGKYTFVIVFPPNFEADTLKGLKPQIQLLIDATAMTQASVGASYISQIFNQEIAQALHTNAVNSPVEIVTNVLYNPNYYSDWLMSTMQIVGSSTLLILLLVGAAVIRERERGTIEHLLVMPVSSSEIACAKIFANSLVILVVSTLSLIFMVKMVFGLPVAMLQIPLFMVGAVFFLFAISALGILLAIIAPTMPQFALLCIPAYMVMYLLSGSTAPVDNMPELARFFSQFLPTTIYGSFIQYVVFRGAGIHIVWLHLVKLAALGAVFLTITLVQFKTMLSRQG
ncbi:ABC transporter permease [Psittacicella hinzii]|uniref:ABC transporter permease n=1 Tax=Psittacicella hinzii TaxID=2028575 RepID=A0A3A1YPN8_9GAMM|nr:ABC transporter permease [Psittacicella hinzii]RIY39466.1 ABC transporter permease [Psittacicella hinzii]